ncbi:hypothetical protein PVL29_021735 [Vitis rotundifolia]|uniref:Uncharacterized protein n=1 Tax=Vitis rotundifolia TaxID=103349 RepID=A0AA38Z0I1_VITRO|nr:hypothetical protein PVL29_021735 [Vitis rotundifolia]
MGLGSVCVTVPAVAAAVGLFFFDRSHSRDNQGFGGSMEDLVVRMKEKVKGGQVAKVAVAPQFDGLHCFETMVEVVSR